MFFQKLKKRMRKREKESVIFLPPFFILPFFLSLKLGITDGQKSRANKQTRVNCTDVVGMILERTLERHNLPR
jgi:hypothetical protein